MEIEEYIVRELNADEQEIALEFVDFLREKKLTFYKDECECWKEKIYYWVKFNNECVCFIVIKDPEEPNNSWTVWSADMDSDGLEKYQITQELKEIAWRNVDHCGCCGSCDGGRHKNIFGKNFDDVCGCTFRIDNPCSEDLLFLKEMVNIRMKEFKF